MKSPFRMRSCSGSWSWPADSLARRSRGPGGESPSPVGDDSTCEGSGMVLMDWRRVRRVEGSRKKPRVMVGLPCPCMLTLPCLGLTHRPPRLILRSSFWRTSAPSSSSWMGTSSAGTDDATLDESEDIESALGRPEPELTLARRREDAAARAMGEVYEGYGSVKDCRRVVGGGVVESDMLVVC